jgi:nitroimidazol reductase NimA-like FMN-containing flavoprotein (pyridoxamine 5'-phosphate oxidase superfamily)
VIFIYTTEGKKTEIIDQNPNICLQIEDVKDNQHWTSVVVEASATRLTAGKERDTAIEIITKINPTLTPAVSVRWMDDWVRENREVVYRITPVVTSGRRAVARGGTFIRLEEKIM